MGGRMGALTASSWTFRELMIFIVGKLMLVLSFTWPFSSAAAGLHPLPWASYAGYLIVFFANWFSCSFWLTLINVPAHLTMDGLEDKDVQDIDFANTQTEHHLFPTVPFRFLPDITPIIQEVSEKHNVNFRKPYDGFVTVFKLYLDRIVYLSKPESEEKAPAAPAVVLEVEA